MAYDQETQAKVDQLLGEARLVYESILEAKPVEALAHSIGRARPFDKLTDPELESLCLVVASMRKRMVAAEKAVREAAAKEQPAQAPATSTQPTEIPAPSGAPAAQPSRRNRPPRPPAPAAASSTAAAPTQPNGAPDKA